MAKTNFKGFPLAETIDNFKKLFNSFFHLDTKILPRFQFLFSACVFLQTIGCKLEVLLSIANQVAVPWALTVQADHVLSGLHIHLHETVIVLLYGRCHR